jgi:predicted Rossmann fold nucleotide-binding protein DprA/Smf involved in DNA uptake
LSESEAIVFDLIGSYPARLDDIAEKSKLSSGELFSILLNLELRGLIYQTGGQQFIRV